MAAIKKAEEVEATNTNKKSNRHGNIQLGKFMLGILIFFRGFFSRS